MALLHMTASFFQFKARVGNTDQAQIVVSVTDKNGNGIADSWTTFEVGTIQSANSSKVKFVGYIRIMSNAGCYLLEVAPDVSTWGSSDYIVVISVRRGGDSGQTLLKFRLE